MFLFLGNLFNFKITRAVYLGACATISSFNKMKGKLQRKSTGMTQTKKTHTQAPNWKLSSSWNGVSIKCNKIQCHLSNHFNVVCLDFQLTGMPGSRKMNTTDKAVHKQFAHVAKHNSPLRKENCTKQLLALLNSCHLKTKTKKKTNEKKERFVWKNLHIKKSTRKYLVCLWPAGEKYNQCTLQMEGRVKKNQCKGQHDTITL